MELICAIEGDQGTPVRMWSTVAKVGPKVVEAFVERWANIYMPPSDFHPALTREEKMEIVRGLLADGDSWWFDETWCFQIHRDRANV
jgi:hypothetical protein